MLMHMLTCIYGVWPHGIISSIILMMTYTMHSTHTHTHTHLSAALNMYITHTHTQTHKHTHNKKTKPTAGEPLLTGLEGSAVDGQGTGITPFVPSRQMFNLTSGNLRVDISPFVNEALSGFGSAGGGDAGSGMGWCCG